jgi:hypothetical protein
MPRRLVLPALSALLIAVALLVWGLPWLTRDRPAMTSTPTPPAFGVVTPIVLAPGARACESLVAFAPETRTAVVLSAKQPGEGPRLRVSAEAPGYRGSGEIAAGYHGEQVLTASLPAPPRNAIGTVCVTNEGRRTVSLQGTTEGRVQNRSETTVDGEPHEAKMSLLLTEGAERSLADRPGEIAGRIAAFKPPIVGSVSLAVVALLILLGVPAAVVYVVARGIADDED